MGKVFHKFDSKKITKHRQNSKRAFKGLVSPAEYIDTVFNFAIDMASGNTGEHRGHRSGGTHNREPKEVFIDTFQGKLAEYGVYKFFKEKGLEVSEPDTERMPLGEWDSVDIVVNGYRLCVKSAAFFSNNLLLEVKDWDEEGRYKPNIEKDGGEYSFFLLCRVKPNLKELLKKKENEPHYKRTELLEHIKKEKWEIDIPGYLTRDELKYLINNQYIIYKDDILGEKTVMDADNYYCQSGDLHPIDEFVEESLSGD